MGLFVTTTGTDVPIEELGITIFDPTVDYDLTGQFDSEDLKNADSLTTAITGGVLIWKKTAGGAAVAAADYDPDVSHADEANTGTGDQGDRVVTFKDLLNNGPNGGGPMMFTNSGNLVPSAYFSMGTVSTSNTGLIMKGLNSVVSITCSNDKLVTGSDAKIILVQRTALDTFIDVLTTQLVIPIGQYKATGAFDVALLADPEMCARLEDDSGSLRNPILTAQLRYDGATP